MNRLRLPTLPTLPHRARQAGRAGRPVRATAGTASRVRADAGLTGELESIVIPVAEQVAAATRPAQLGVASVERELDERAGEQDAAWQAAAEVAQRPARVRAAATQTRARAALGLLEADQALVARTAEDYAHAIATLSPWLRRKPSDSLRYVLVTVLLALADAGAVTSALISMGDVVWTATVLGVGVGVAAVTGGLIGGEVQDIRQARIRARDPETLGPDERRYLQVFSNPQSWIPVTKIAVGVMLSIAAILGVGIYALRTDLEGPLAGACFAMLAVATALGSGVNAYMHADLVADLLANYHAAYTHAVKRHTRLAAGAALAAHPAAHEEAASIAREHDALGRAAISRVQALKWGVLRRNPHVFGHGDPAPLPTGLTGLVGPIGRRPRTDPTAAAAIPDLTPHVAPDGSPDGTLGGTAGVTSGRGAA